LVRRKFMAQGKDCGEALLPVEEELGFALK
jgi:hypothetical protein